MSRWRAIFAAFIIFAAGAAAGAIVTKVYTPEPPAKTEAPRPSPFPSPRGFIERLDREVKLTVEQRQQIQAILEASQERMKQLWEPVAPMAKEEHRRTRKEISEVLTPEQRQLWEKHWRAKEKKEGDHRDKDGKEARCRSTPCHRC